MMRTMNIIRRSRDLKSRALQSRLYTGGQNDQHQDEIRIQDVISISNNQFCAKRGKYTKDIREELDPRDKEYTFPFQTTFNATLYLRQRAVKHSEHQSNQQQYKKDKGEKKPEEYLRLRRAVFDYVSEVCQNVNSIAFRLLSKGDLNDGQTKAFAVRIILANIQSVLTDIHFKLQQYAERQERVQLGRQFDDLMERLTRAIDEELSQIFSQLAGHYPQAPPAGATANMREVIADVNRSQDERNNLIYSSDIKIAKYVKFSPDGKTILSKPEDYTGFVMEVINQAIGITRTIVDQDLTLFQKFQQFNEKLFAIANTDKKSQKLSPQDKNRLVKLGSSQRVRIFHNILQAKKDKQQSQIQQQQQRQAQAFLQFQQRLVDQYKKNHKVLLAQKIPNHVKQFSHADIKEGNFRVSNSSVLRIMTKWVESLQDLFEKPEYEIERRLYLFKDINNKLIDSQIDKVKQKDNLKKGLANKVAAEYKNVKMQLDKLKEENALFQSYILSEVQSESSYLKRFSKVREASAQMNAIAIEYTKKYLCILIHYLIKAGCYVFRYEQIYLFVNLVVFRVGDLLRSKLQCSEKSFINVMNILNQLDNSKQMEGRFKLVRIKNKLGMRDNNILINYMFMGKVQCELQLSVQKMDDRDKHYYQFCHFLYQLTRGKLGVLTECATVVCQHDSIINSSTDSHYRPKCYEILQRKKRIHKIHEKGKDIYKCIKCGQLKMGENTTLFQEQTQCNTCIVKQDGSQQKMRHKNEFLLKQIRIRNYGQIKNSDYIISADNQKTDAKLKLYMSWQTSQEMKFFLVEVNEYALREFQKPDFQYSSLNYFNILAKRKKNEDLKELTYNLGNKITAQALETVKIDPKLLLKMQPFFYANLMYRAQKNMIKSIQFKSEFIVANNSKVLWKNILQKLFIAYFSDDIKQLRYRRYKKLDWTHIKYISLQKNEIASVKQLLELTPNCTKIILQQNKITQINFDKQIKLQYLNMCGNQVSTVDFKNSPLLTTLRMEANKLQTINLRSSTKLETLKLQINNLKEVDLGQNIDLVTLNLSKNQVQHINLSSNIRLKQLALDNNKLKEIDLSSNINLTDLKLFCNNLKKIDLSSNTNLATAGLSSNQLEQINLGSNINLTYLQLSSNNFKEIDLSSTTNLKQLYLYNNKLQHINLGSNINISYLHLQNNNLSEIDISSITNVGLIVLSKNKIQQIDLSSNIQLQQLIFAENKLKQIDLSSNINLKQLDLNNNQLQQINFSSCINLTELMLNNNRLKHIDLTSNPHIEKLNLFQNQLQEINVSFNTKLKQLYLNDNRLKEIDLTAITNLQKLNLGSNQLKQISLSSNIKLQILCLSSNKLKSIDLSLNLSLAQLYLTNCELAHADLQNNFNLHKIWLYGNRLQSVKFWTSRIHKIDNFLDHQQQKQCKVTLLYRKKDSSKHDEIFGQIKEKYRPDSTFNTRSNCQFIFAIEERN